MLFALFKKGGLGMCLVGMGMAAPVQAEVPGRLLDTIVARVNQEVVLQSELEEWCKQLQLEGTTVDAAKKQELVRELVVHKLFVAEAAATAYKPPKAYVQQECARTIAAWIQRVGTEAKLVAYFQQPMHRIKEDLKIILKDKYAALAMQQKLTKDVGATPAEVKAYFDALPASQRSYCPSAFDVRQLVIYPKIAAVRREAARQKLCAFKQAIAAGTDTFPELARLHSEDAVSAVRGGEIGWVSKGMLAPAYEKAALSLELGELSDPVASEFGVHLIELIGRTQGRYNSRHILQVLEPTQAEIDAAEIEIRAVREKIASGVLSFEEAVKQFSEDATSRSEGGVFAPLIPAGDALPSTLLRADALEPTIYFAVESLKEGETTAPQCMGQQGRWGWRLLHLKKKVEPHELNLTQDYEQLQQRVLNEKKQEVVRKWIQQARSNFVIQLAPEYDAANPF